MLYFLKSYTLKPEKIAKSWIKFFKRFIHTKKLKKNFIFVNIYIKVLKNEWSINTLYKISLRSKKCFVNKCKKYSRVTENAFKYLYKFKKRKKNVDLIEKKIHIGIAAR